MQVTLVSLKFDFCSHFGFLLNFQSENSSNFNVSHNFGSKTQEINSMRPFSFNIVFQQYKEHASICLNNFSFYLMTKLFKFWYLLHIGLNVMKSPYCTHIYLRASRCYPILVPQDVVSKVSMWQNKNKWLWKHRTNPSIMYNTFMSIDGMCMSLCVFICVEVNVYTYVCIYMYVCVRVHPP